MLRPLIRLLSSLWRPFGRRGGGVDGGGGDGAAGRAGLLWSRDLGRCAGGEFSMAVVQANRVLEDQSRIESGPFGTFVGVYDGHGGPDAARYVCDHLFAHFREISSGPQGVTCDGIQRAFLATEESFIALVSQLWNTRPDIATTGSCCLVGVVCQQTLYVANLGDSRVILGKKVGSTGEIAAISLSTEHNANVDAVRQELQAQHPNDPQIVILKHGVWRIKGIIQVSRSIGDAYMKHAQYNREPINPKFRIAEPMKMPILTANPSIMFHHLEQSDSFLIFASDGLWEHLSDQKAVEIVHSHPRAQENERCDIQISKGLTRRSAGIFMMILLSSLYSLIMRRFKITCKFLSYQFEVLWIIEAHESSFRIPEHSLTDDQHSQHRNFFIWKIDCFVGF